MGTTVEPHAAKRTGEEKTRAGKRGAKRHFGRLLIALSLVLGLLVPFFYGGWDAFVELTRLPGGAPTYALLFFLMVTYWAFRAARFYVLARALRRRLPAGVAFGTAVAAEFAGNVTPGGSGAFATKLFIFHRNGVPVGEGTGLLAVDRLLDLTWFLLVMPVLAALWLNSGELERPIRTILPLFGIVVAAVIALVLLARHHRTVLWRAVRRLRRQPRKRWRNRVAMTLLQLRHSIRMLLRMGPRRLALMYLLVTGSWLTRYGVLPVLLWVWDYEISWTYLFLVQMLVFFAGQVALLPGGGGSIELGIGFFLRALPDDVIAAVLVAWRVFTYYGAILVGAPLFVWVTGRMSLREQQAEVERIRGSKE